MMNDKTKVSIITVCLNSEKTIGRTIESIERQIYRNFEYIIIDGGSTDETLNIISEHAKCVSKLVSESDSGIYNAMNKGWKMATGELIAFLNSDDWYTDDALDQVVQLYESGNYDWIIGNTINVYQDGRERKRPILSQESVSDLNYKMEFCHQAVFAKKALFYMYGGFDENYRISADYEWLLRVYKQGIKVGILNKYMTYFSLGGLSGVERKRCVTDVKEIALQYLEGEGTEALYSVIVKTYNDQIKYIEENEMINDYLLKKTTDIQQALQQYFALGEKVYLWGIGYMFEECVQVLGAAKLCVIGVFDKEVEVEKKCAGIPLLPKSKLKNICEKIIITSIKYEDEIAEELQENDCGFVKYSDIRKWLVRSLQESEYFTERLENV